MSGDNQASLNPEVQRAISDTTVSVSPGYTLITVRKTSITIDGEIHDCWELKQVTNNHSSEPEDHYVAASASSPGYYVQYIDSSTSTNKSVCLLDPDSFPVMLLAGTWTNSAIATSTNVIFFPEDVFDFSPFVNQVNARLDG